MTNKISVDQEFCQAHGRCYAVFPDLFEPDDEGRAQVKNNGAVPESNSV
ncbi:ferredoxin, partial [Rhodococcus sp. (in: high G+C Gram-positive bacteria)]